MKRFIDVLKTNHNHAYDFICNNYYSYSKDELKDIIKELLYAIYSNDKMSEIIILREVAEELENWYIDTE